GPLSAPPAATRCWPPPPPRPRWPPPRGCWSTPTGAARRPRPRTRSKARPDGSRRAARRRRRLRAGPRPGAARAGKVPATPTPERRGSIGGNGQLEDEPCAAAFAVLVPELAAGVGDDLPRQAQPQAAGGIVRRRALVQAGERLEQFALARRR